MPASIHKLDQTDIISGIGAPLMGTDADAQLLNGNSTSSVPKFNLDDDDGPLNMELKAEMPKAVKKLDKVKLKKNKSIKKVDSKIVIKPLHVDDSGFIFEEQNDVI